MDFENIADGVNWAFLIVPHYALIAGLGNLNLMNTIVSVSNCHSNLRKIKLNFKILFIIFSRAVPGAAISTRHALNCTTCVAWHHLKTFAATPISLAGRILES